MTVLTADVIADGLTPHEPRISPDGRYVAFVVAPEGRREEQPRSAIWLTSSDGEVGARQVTAGLTEDRRPRWSIDSRSLFFLSDRAERGKRTDIYRLPLDGGEAEALTDWRAKIDALEPLADGATIAFLAPDSPDDEDRRRELTRDDAEVFGERWRPARLRLLDLASRGIRTIDALDDRHVACVAPSPDGARLAVVTWPTPELDNSLRDADLRLVETASGVARVICSLPAGAQALAWDARGDRLYYLAHRRRDWRGGLVLFAVDLASPTPMGLTETLDGCPVELWSGAAGEPTLLVAAGLDTAVVTVDPETMTLTRRRLLPGEANGLHGTPGGQTLTLCRSDATNPFDVWAIAGDASSIRVTRLRPELTPIAWGSQTRRQWTAPDGLAIDGLLILPPGAAHADGPFPLMTLVHGGPYHRYADRLRLGWHDWGQWLATAGYAVLLPNPRGGLGRGGAFADTVAGEVGKADWGDIVAGIDDLIAEGIADPDRLGIGGWSQGGFMTAWAVGQTDRFKVGIMGAGVSDWGMMVAESDLSHFEAMLGGSTGWEGPGPHRHDALSPISYVHRVRTPLLILHGANDERVPVSQGRFIARGLREYGIPFELVVYPREPHAIRERAHQIDLLRRLRAWTERWLGPGWTPSAR
jgi:dipeptidyl aminopeptidase/acylaminoacyl peptidase